MDAVLGCQGMALTVTHYRRGALGGGGGKGGCCCVAQSDGARTDSVYFSNHSGYHHRPCSGTPTLVRAAVRRLQGDAQLDLTLNVHLERGSDEVSTIR